MIKLHHLQLIATVGMLLMTGMFLFPVAVTCVCLSPWVYSKEIGQYVKTKYQRLTK